MEVEETPQPERHGEQEPIPDVPFTLTDQQKAYADEVLDPENHRNYFFTGGAGTGKTVLLRYIRSRLDARAQDPSEIAVVASTGTAAVQIQAVTAHAWFMYVRPGEGLQANIPIILRSEAAKDRIRKAKVLIFEEISMVPKTLFDNFGQICRRVRGSEAPFGGIRLLIFGDFLQLLPIEDETQFRTYYGEQEEGMSMDVWRSRHDIMAYEADEWKLAFHTEQGTIRELTELYRTREPFFGLLLSNLRLGQMNPYFKNKMVEATRSAWTSIEAAQEGWTVLSYLRQIAENVNNAMMRDLRRKGVIIYRFEAQDSHTRSQLYSLHLNPNLYDNSPYLSVFYSAIGERVMLTSNMRLDGIYYPNGTIGYIVGYAPLRPGGQPLPRVQFIQITSRASPVTGILEGPRRIHTIPIKTWSVRMQNETITRKNVPLMAAWAMTVHKAQGATLDRVYFDLTGTTGKAALHYVALSRVRSLQTIKIGPGDFRPSVYEPAIAYYYKYVIGTPQQRQIYQTEIDEDVQANQRLNEQIARDRLTARHRTDPDMEMTQD